MFATSQLIQQMGFHLPVCSCTLNKSKTTSSETKSFFFFFCKSDVFFLLILALPSPLSDVMLLNAQKNRKMETRPLTYFCFIHSQHSLIMFLDQHIKRANIFSALRTILHFKGVLVCFFVLPLNDPSVVIVPHRILPP